MLAELSATTAVDVVSALNAKEWRLERATTVRFKERTEYLSVNVYFQLTVGQFLMWLVARDLLETGLM